MDNEKEDRAKVICNEYKNKVISYHVFYVLLNGLGFRDREIQDMKWEYSPDEMG